MARSPVADEAPAGKHSTNIIVSRDLTVNLVKSDI